MAKAIFMVDFDDLGWLFMADGEGERKNINKKSINKRTVNSRCWIFYCLLFKEKSLKKLLRWIEKKKKKESQILFLIKIATLEMLSESYEDILT
jgi:hypothetical protein